MNRWYQHTGAWIAIGVTALASMAGTWAGVYSYMKDPSVDDASSEYVSSQFIGTEVITVDNPDGTESALVRGNEKVSLKEVDLDGPLCLRLDTDGELTGIAQKCSKIK
jgi:hypothetical protein